MKMSYLIPLGDLGPGHVLDGHGPRVSHPDPGVHSPEAPAAKHLAHPVGSLEAVSDGGHVVATGGDHGVAAVPAVQTAPHIAVAALDHARVGARPGLFGGGTLDVLDDFTWTNVKSSCRWHIDIKVHG